MHFSPKTQPYAQRGSGAQEAAIEADLNQRLLQQEAVAWFGEYALRSRDLDDLFEQCVQLAAQVLDLEFVKLLELTPDGRFLLLRAGVGWTPGLVGKTIIGLATDSQSGFTLMTDEPIIVDDLEGETRFTGSKLLVDHGVVSGMTVSIPGKEKPFGVLGVHTGQQRFFNLHDARFLKSIASILAAAIERFRVENELRRSHNEMEIILNGITEGVTAQETTDRLVYANQAAANLIGYPNADALLNAPMEEVRGKFLILDENGEPLSWETLPNRQSLYQGKTASATVRFRVLATDEERWLIYDSTPVFDDQGQVALVVNIFRDITATVQEERRQKLISEASRLMSSSLDYSITLDNLADLAVRNLADWCIIHILTENGDVEQLAVAHKDQQKLEMARSFIRQYPPSVDRNSQLARVLRTGEPELILEITDEMLRAFARSPEHLEVMRNLEMRSAMLVPLVARGNILGVIALIWAESGRKYSLEDQQTVAELARCAAVAIDNARLYMNAQELNAGLEQRVALRTKQLVDANRELNTQFNERVKAETALRESEMLLQSLFESAPDATVLVNRQGQIVRVNRQTETAFGYKREELIGAPVHILLPERFREQHGHHQVNFFQNAVNRPMGAGRELYARRKDGTEFPVDIMLSPVINHENDLVISSIRDMTEQRRLQAELAETHQRLFESVEAERLSLSRELHDGPIQDLYGLAFNQELLASALHDEADLKTLEASKETVLAVVQTLRSICGELRPATLEHLGLEKAILSYLTKLEEKYPDLKFTIDLASDEKALPERVRLAMYRVFQNAINNVVRHAKASQVSITFKVDGETATLQVQDDGRGFNVPEKWVELARAGHFGLVGMVERVEAVGGRLLVDSAPGRGTTLMVECPVRAAP